jgi:hypothetical protein
MNTWLSCWCPLAISGRIMLGRGISEIEAHEQLINALMDLNANLLSASGSAQSEHLLAFLCISRQA